MRYRDGGIGRRIVSRQRVGEGDDLIVGGQRIVLAGDTPFASASGASATITRRTFGEEIVESASRKSQIASQNEVPRAAAENYLGMQSAAQLRAVPGLNRAFGSSLTLDEALELREIGKL